MIQDPAIVFIHSGHSWYLPYALKQARFANPSAEVVIIGDPCAGTGAKHCPISAVSSPGAEAFRASYRHMSTNSQHFEMLCWLRWFYLLEYMKTSGRRAVFHMDSDVLMHSSVGEIDRTHGSALCDVAYLIPDQRFESLNWTASAHMSYWTVEVLEAFCAFILRSFQPGELLDQYRQKWHHHTENDVAGGVCDMTTLYLFARAQGGDVANLSRVMNQSVFDDNVSLGGNHADGKYLMEDGIKRIHFAGSAAYFTTSDDAQSAVKAHAIHFQGAAKQHMQTYYRGSLHLKGWSRYELFKRLRQLRQKFAG